MSELPSISDIFNDDVTEQRKIIEKMDKAIFISVGVLRRHRCRRASHPRPRMEVWKTFQKQTAHGLLR